MKRMLAFVAIACAVSMADAAGGGADEAMMQLAKDRGCATCHSLQPADRSDASVARPAPSWPEIAARYHGASGAQERLEATVLAGTPKGERHWQRRAAFASMLPNAPDTSPDEARALVRWILAWP